MRKVENVNCCVNLYLDEWATESRLLPSGASGYQGVSAGMGAFLTQGEAAPPYKAAGDQL